MAAVYFSAAMWLHSQCSIAGATAQILLLQQVFFQELSFISCLHAYLTCCVMLISGVFRGSGRPTVR